MVGYREGKNTISRLRVAWEEVDDKEDDIYFIISTSIKYFSNILHFIISIFFCIIRSRNNVIIVHRKTVNLMGVSKRPFVIERAIEYLWNVEEISGTCLYSVGPPPSRTQIRLWTSLEPLTCRCICTDGGAGTGVAIIQLKRPDKAAADCARAGRERRISVV